MPGRRWAGSPLCRVAAVPGVVAVRGPSYDRGVTELLLPVGDRVLDVAVHGRTDGTEAASDQGVLVYHHGTPGWRVPPAPVVAAAARRGLRLDRKSVV